MPQPNTNFFALLIGVGDYQSERFANVPATIEDVCQLGAILKDPTLCGYPADHVTTLTGAGATLANIRRALASLCDIPASGATVVLYFSGHGGRVMGGDGWRAFLCPHDIDPSNVGGSALSGDEFSTCLAAIPAERLVVILDCCYAGSTAQLKSDDHIWQWKAGFPEPFYEALSQGSGRVVIASSKEDQFSYVRKEGDLSLFTYHLAAAMRGGAAIRRDGLIHILDVFHYVSEAVGQVNPRQSPVLKADNLDSNFAIALDRGGSKIAGTAAASTRIGAICERIIHEPLAGADELRVYLAQSGSDSALSKVVDDAYTNLRRVETQRHLYTPIDWQETRNRAIFSLLRICSQLEDGGVASLETQQAPPAVRPGTTFKIGKIEGDGNTIVQAESATLHIQPQPLGHPQKRHD